MKTFSFIIAFLFAGLFLVSFVDYANAGLCTSCGGSFDKPSDCVKCCQEYCECMEGEDCSGRKGEDRKDCNTKNKILVGCCTADCVEEGAGSGCLIPDGSPGSQPERPSDSAVCEVIKQAVEDFVCPNP